MNSKRNSSFELLRIISMYLIILHHFVVHGNTDMGGGISAKKIHHAMHDDRWESRC